MDGLHQRKIEVFQHQLSQIQFKVRQLLLQTSEPTDSRSACYISLSALATKISPLLYKSRIAKLSLIRLARNNGKRLGFMA